MSTQELRPGPHRGSHREAPDAVASPTRPGTLALAGAFAAIYIIWGSTYLAIRFAVETVPPFSMAGIRFVIAGAILLLWARWRGVERPSAANVRAALIVGTLLLFGGNGLVTWAEERVASGVAAVLVALVPVWMVVLDRVAFRKQRPNALVWVGVAAGFAGVFVLARPGAPGAGGSTVDPLHQIDAVGAGLVVLATLSWAWGSLYARSASLPRSMAMASGLEMLLGGAVLLVAALLKGEWREFDATAISTRSTIAVVYLITFGSIVALSAYGWLLRVTSAAAVSTYAFVNPVVAVFLGWLLAGELVTPHIFFASTLIIGAVLLIHVSKRRRPRIDRTFARRSGTQQQRAHVPEDLRACVVQER